MTVLNQPLQPEAEPGGGSPVDAQSRQQTVLPQSPSRPTPEDRRPQSPRQLSGARRADVLAFGGALAASLAATTLLWTQLAPFSGILGNVVVSWCLFVLVYAILVSFDENRTTMRDRIAAVVVHSLAFVVVATLGLVIAYTFAKGWTALRHFNFYTQDLHVTGPTAPLTQGGVLHAVIGSLIELAIAMAIAVPLGLLAAVFLNEVPGRLNRLVRTVVDAMTALPDVLAGLFIYATLILIFGLDTSGLAAGCALAVTITSIVCRAAYVVLRLVPGGLTEASYALGSGHWRTVWHVTLPTARSGLATAVILGAARAVGETAPVLLTAGATNYVNADPVHGSMMSLPLLAYTLVATPEANYVARGFGAAALLMLLVLVLFGLTRAVGGRGAGVLSNRQLRRRLAASRRDLARYTAHAAAAQAAAGAAGFRPPNAPSRWLLPGYWLPGRRP
jgi:phosphate transport system permease protein